MAWGNHSCPCNQYIHPFHACKTKLGLFCTPHFLALKFYHVANGTNKKQHIITIPCILMQHNAMQHKLWLFNSAMPKINYHSNWALLALPEGVWEAVLGETRTASLVVAFMPPISSKRFHLASRFDFISFSCASFSRTLIMYSS